ncbi:hypothetical protein METBIDRAFT_39643 [Metschnikowia bicuspidata var. bicuspidata NRRL YB-4993]|uniref:Uncharacterized protein n=1 Tax=Metschnikowia bicuspidata var. bicuspidata NRRL YB-4993 TaxID=869754 RepID=A0A1A0HD39_9ASCO|nr:hypothetical protein METBIDRAFT_39643 [Metschnikowia bicuspidata var. bicuspidata NRRL YB-4993]OBA21890.1 hypothetical protein METBIDRAFT_39643 [Metschnikowia bicuspidata var. bicuspidata NRRL YB-4993]
MDLSGSGFLRAIPGFGSLATMSSEMTPRDKRIYSQVEKTLASFGDLDEWADYIAFLARLKKLLLLPAESPHLIPWLPLADQVLAKLALCLSPLLPNGVHSKTLELYENIFDALDINLLNRDIAVWLPGILPVVSFGSMQVKPQVISLYKNSLIIHLTPATLKKITKPVLLSLLCGLDDENSEVFGDVMSLLDSFKAKMASSAHFWQNFFVCVITSPEKRLGALNWCSARLPVFSAIELGAELKFSAEAQACLSSESGLLIRAFASALNTRSSFNQANDIIVMRGFFDLLLSHLPLDSPVVTQVISVQDKELLIMACCRVTLKKDMSLNRRLWKWLLGPDNGEESIQLEDGKTYFSKHALQTIDYALKLLISSGDTQQKLDAYNISLAMIMDRWEISQYITALVFKPIIESCFKAVQTNDARAPELLAAGKRFFDQVEACHIWHFVTHDLILQPEGESRLHVIDFLLKNFTFPEDEDNVHAPLAVIAFILRNEASEPTVSTLELLVELVLLRTLFSTGELEKPAFRSKDNLLRTISDYYASGLQSGNELAPINALEISHVLMTSIEHWYIQSMSQGTLSDRLASLLCDLLASVPHQKGVSYLDEDLLKTTFLQYPEFDCVSRESNCGAPAMFGIVKLYQFLIKSMSFFEKSKMLKIILSNLWETLISLYPANYQVEAVRCIFDLRIYFEVHEIEAGISYLLLQTSEKIRFHCFYKLWSLSQDVNESEMLLSNPLFVVLDSFRDMSPGSLVDAQKFVYNVCNDGSANRLLKIVTGPLLTFPIVQKQRTTIGPHDDFKLFAYYLETILNLLHSNDKELKESLAHEFVPAENAGRVELFTSNEWDVSNYKTLLLNIIQKCLTLKFPEDSVEENNVLRNFTSCISKVLELYSLLLTGSETDFLKHFDLLIRSCLYYVSESRMRDMDLEVIESMFIKHIREFLDIAKSMNANVLQPQTDSNSGSPSFVTFINRGITTCTSPTLLEKWLSLMKSTLYLLDNSIYGEMLIFNQTIIEKMNSCFSAIKKFENFDNCCDSESFLSICLTGLEDLLSICHSYLMTPAPSSTTKAQQGENGFFGNVILGVFQIESPQVKSEVEQRVYSVIIAFQDAIKAAFAIWSWANSKPVAEGMTSDFYSQKSIIYMSNKLKFRAKKLLGNLSELERQETIETILETDEATDTKIKIIHVLDSGHSQLSLPHILNSILTRCLPQNLSDRQKSTMYSSINEINLAQFLVPYYNSIDFDTMDEIWEMTLGFIKEVSLNPGNFKHFLLTILQVVQVVSHKVQARKLNDDKRSARDLSNYFLSILNAAISKKSAMASSDLKVKSKKNDDEEESQVEELALLIGSFGDIIQDQDRIVTAVTNITSTVIAPQVKLKAIAVPSSILKLILQIGKHHPIKAWKQVVFETFVDNSFFQNGKHNLDQWRTIIGVWIKSDKERMSELVNKITPPVQSSAANIFIWNDNSEVEDRAMVLRRISYLILVQPKDFFVKNLDGIMGRLSTALNSTCPPLYKSEALSVFRALSLKFSEGHLLPYWSLVVQSLVEVFSAALAKNSKHFSGIEAEELALILSACKLLDQLLLIQFDEINLTSWLFVSRGSVVNDECSSSLIDRLALKSESLLTKEDPLNVQGPRENEKSKPLLLGVLEIKNIANLKKFFGLLGYINFERSYGLTEPDLDACEKDLFQDLGKHWA